MKALVYNGANSLALEERPKPSPAKATDAVVKLTYSTICGTDLHITKGDVPTCKPGTILGHEGVGIIEDVGAGVGSFKKGDSVLISCISACGTCEYCRKGMTSHCVSGGWVLGNKIDGTQAEFVRIPNAESSLYKIPKGVDPKAMVMLSDILPTGFECGVLNGKVEPGSSVVIVGSGPVGLAALITAQLYSPSLLIMVDTDENRLKVAKQFGAHYTTTPDKAEGLVKELTDSKGCDTVIEAVGVPAAFHQCQELVAPGGTIANVGVHGVKADIYLEKLWDRNISITTRLVDATTTPMLLKLLAAHNLPAERLITHSFRFADMLNAYSTFKAAAENKALKVIIEM
ncbi:alcohol dehydrogenase GroES domain-containing protein [Glonium stellatum]|uniref:Alcohol dehydrogenase GroES domain-containing protein n=1 Tax=Glonium stellatum TaxID=574774 RepID=A0A8E2EWL3_9PEZI|nr:alcohol dehydrogenase GroES domain-containing protein [Glonium stellatum]